MLGHLDEHSVESLTQFVHLLIALLVALVLHHVLKIYERLFEGLAQLLVDTRIHLILDVRLLALGFLLHLHALEVELLLLMMRPQAQHEQGDENIQDISPPSGIERRFDHYLQSAFLGLFIVVTYKFDHEGVGARGQSGKRDIGVVRLSGYPVVAQSLQSICELHVVVGKSLVGTHLYGKLALVALQHESA